MRLSDIINLGMEYIKLGLVAVGLVGICFFLWFFLYCRKRRKEGQKLHVTKLLLWGIFLCYMVVVLGATVLSRGNYYGNVKVYPLFYSYVDAWNDFSMAEWRQIILNICMFVPLGFLLPLLTKKLAVFWKIYVIGFGLTFFIELIQIVFHRGIFEPDDLLGNTLGAMIGYGLYALFVWIESKWKKSENIRLGQVLLLQLPLCIVVIGFVAIFTAYHVQELGNLSSRHIMKQENLQVTTKITFSDADGSAPVYKVPVLSVEETEELAETIFAMQNLSVDKQRNDIYDNSALYYSSEGNHLSIWVDYDGGTFSYTNYEESFDDEKGVEDSATEEMVRLALSEIGMYVPQNAVFENTGDGNYRFSAGLLLDKDTLYDGHITCTYNENGKIPHANYQMIKLYAYKDFPIISEKEAYEKLVDGQFMYYRPNDETLTIEVTDIALIYETDTKGFYQPVYAFESLIGEWEGTIEIGAIQ